MELDNIKELLEKYFEATTTDAEESTLRAYFSREKVAPQLEQYKPMFTYFSKAREERFTRPLPVMEPRKNHNLRWVSVAAVAVLALGIYFGKNYEDQREKEQEQALYAYNETKKALDLLAENFGKGTEKVAYLRGFEETKQKIYNNN